MTATKQTEAEAVVFLDLVLSDDDLVRAEFDALIAACWESPCEPPDDKVCPPAGGWAAPPPSPWQDRPGFPVVAGAATHRPDGRERGPPGAAGHWPT